MRSKRKLLVGVFLALVVLIIAISAVLFLKGEEQKRTEERNHEYAAENTHTFEMGEPIVLDSAEDEKGFDFGGYVAGFSWKGTMGMTLLDAREYASPDEAGLDAAHLIPASARDYQERYLVLKMKLRNEDAELPAAPTDMIDHFYISTFVNLMHDSDPLNHLPDIVYFDGTAPDADAKGTFSFVLGKGQEKTFTVGLAVAAADLGEDLFVGVGDAHYGKYRIKIGLQRGGS